MMTAIFSLPPFHHLILYFPHFFYLDGGYNGKVAVLASITKDCIDPG